VLSRGAFGVLRLGRACVELWSASTWIKRGFQVRAFPQWAGWAVTGILLVASVGCADPGPPPVGRHPAGSPQ
jgi:hypothetical protein